MPIRAVAIALVVLCLPLGAQPAPASPAATERPVDYAACEGIEVLGTGDPAALRAHVPADFDIPDNPLVIVGANVCGDGAASVARGFWAIQVTPRDPALASQRARNYFWEPEHYVQPGTAFAAALHSVHARATPAAVEVDISATGFRFLIDPAGPGLAYAFQAHGAGVPASSLSATAIPPFREYFAANGGYAYLDGAFAGRAGHFGVGGGELTTGGTGAGALHYGPSSTHVAGALADFDYTGAVVGFIPRP